MKEQRSALRPDLITSSLSSELPSPFSKSRLAGHVSRTCYLQALHRHPEGGSCKCQVHQLRASTWTDWSSEPHWHPGRLWEGESGSNHRPIRKEWVREIRKQCKQQRVAFFFKQWGGRTAKAGGRILDGKEWNEYPPIADPMLQLPLAQ